MSDYSPPLGDFQPPDPVEDIDAKWEAWFNQQEKNGYAVISRDEWKSRLNEAAIDGYAEGRNDEREQWAGVLEALRNILALDDGDCVELWPHAALFEAARVAIFNVTGKEE